MTIRLGIMSKNSNTKSKTNLLWIEGRWGSDPSFIPSLTKKGFEVDVVNNGKSAIDYLDNEQPAVVVIDAASMRTNGKRICMSIREISNGLPIMLISAPDKIDRSNNFVNSTLVLPFTSRKLVNRLIPLLPHAAGDLLEKGPLRINPERNQVICFGRKTTLTPRLMRLLELLLENEGEVMRRDVLFKTVWKTDYIGDTRTLDVHISWLRDAIEKDPKKPQLLTTIRGTGYRLDI